MIFNIFAVLILCCYFNQSIDFVHYRRFTSERRLARQPTIDVGGTRTRLKSSLGPLDRFICWINYNQVGFLQFVSYSLNVIFLMITLIKSSVYALFPVERNPITDLYVHEVPRFLESIYLVDLFNKLERGTMLNRLVAVQAVHFLLLRFRSIQLSFRKAEMNRGRYHKLNIVDINMSYLHVFRTSFRGWIKFLMEGGKHECDHFNALSSERGQKMKMLLRRLKRADRIDRIYYVNQIDFDECYLKRKDFVLDQSKTSRDDQCEISSNTPPSNRLTWKRAFGCEKKPRFVPRPFHRLDPRHLFGVTCLYLFNSSLVFGLSSIALYGFYVVGLREKLSPSNGQPKLDARFLIFLVQRWMFVILYGMNAYDHGLMCYNTFLSYSRANKVWRMLDREISFQRYHVVRFAQFLHEKNLTVNDESLRLTIQDPKPAQTTLGGRFLSNTFHGYPHRTQHDVYRTSRDLTRISEVEQNKLDYRRNFIPESDIIETNQNIDHIIDLIGVLLDELSDLKSSFTLFVSTAILFGTCGAAITFTLVLELREPHEVILVHVYNLVSVAPMIIALLMAAVGELSVGIEHVFLFRNARFQPLTTF